MHIKPSPMKFPSIKNLAEGAVTTIKRFPIEILFALTGTIAATVNVELDNLNPVAESWCVRVIMMANLGLLLSLSASLFTGSRNFSKGKTWGIKAGAVVLALLLLLLIDPDHNQADWIRFFLLSLAFHLLVAYAAYTGKGHVQGFWQFNKTLFLRFLTSALYSAVLYGGLAAALGAVNLLFNVKFEFDTFLILWIWIVGMFSTTFFLAGVPADHSSLDADNSYPKGLKVFTQYVLIPLATIYLAILLAYEAKILIQWNLPKGYVSYLILGYAVFGILSLLLVYPIREHEENKWLKTFARSFYFLLLPLLVLLFVAVGTRVFAYGITEQRYFLIALALWLLFISIYFLLFKKQNIKLIPISLSIVTLISVYGPQGAFSVSKYSQTRILVNIFKKHNAVKNGKLLRLAKIDSADGVEAAEKLEYLVSQHDLVSLQPYIAKDLNAVSDSISNLKGTYRTYANLNRYEQRQRKLAWVSKYLGLTKYLGRYSYINDDDSTLWRSYHFSPAMNVTLTKDYDYLVIADSKVSRTVTINNISFKQPGETAEKTSVIIINNQKVVFNLTELAQRLKKRKSASQAPKPGAAEPVYVVPAEDLTITKQIKGFKVSLVIDDIDFNGSKNGEINYLKTSGIFLIKDMR